MSCIFLSLFRSFQSVNVTRLIRISYGDYQLQTIPPGMALEVPLRTFHKRRGPFNPAPKKVANKKDTKKDETDEDRAAPVRWVTNF